MKHLPRPRTDPEALARTAFRTGTLHHGTFQFELQSPKAMARLLGGPGEPGGVDRNGMREAKLGGAELHVNVGNHAVPALQDLVDSDRAVVSRSGIEAQGDGHGGAIRRKRFRAGTSPEGGGQHGHRYDRFHSFFRKSSSPRTTCEGQTHDRVRADPAPSANPRRRRT